MGKGGEVRLTLNSMSNDSGVEREKPKKGDAGYALRSQRSDVCRQIERERERK